MKGNTQPFFFISKAGRTYSYNFPQLLIIPAHLRFNVWARGVAQVEEHLASKCEAKFKPQ
jgi:hypothetical protein